MSRVGQGQWLCHMPPCVEAESPGEIWRRVTGESIPAGVPASTLATGTTERVSERRCSPKEGCLCHRRS